MLTIDLVKSWISALAQSQGFYGRLYRDLDEGQIWEDFVDELNANDCKTSLDMVLLIEG